MRTKWGTRYGWLGLETPAEAPTPGARRTQFCLRGDALHAVMEGDERMNRNQTRRPLGRLMLALLVILVATELAIASAQGQTGASSVELQVGVQPARASAPDRPRGISLDIQMAFPSDTKILALRAPKGLRINFGSFRRCPFLRLAKLGPEICPKGSRVGSGSLEQVGKPASAPFLALNGRMPNSRTNPTGETKTPALLLSFYVPARPVTTPFEIRPERPLGPGFLGEWAPAEPSTQPVTLKLHLVVDNKAKKTRRGVVHYLEAPRRCRRSWLFELTDTLSNGDLLRATDRVKCRRAQ